MNEVKFKDLAVDFLEKLFLSLKESQVEIAAHWDIDHLCYRVDSLNRYEELKKHFLMFGKLLIESDVNGRPIATFKLNSAIQFRSWSIDVVELPAPKPSKPTKEGFEHIEVVCDLSFGDLEKKYQYLKLDLGGLKKDFNQEFELDLGERNLKFHHMSLESVIRVEENKSIFHAVEESKILKAFKKYTPFIAGTFPLGVYTQHSDVDVLMCAENLDEVEQELRNEYGEFLAFETNRSVVDKVETLIVNFNFKSTPFEIFVQNRPVVQQTAFLHFQAEERLLKFGGEDFKKKVMSLRLKDFKTEPAFLQALEMQGDAFAELLRLQKRSNLEIQKMLESV